MGFWSGFTRVVAWTARVAGTVVVAGATLTNPYALVGRLAWAAGVAFWANKAEEAANCMDAAAAMEEYTKKEEQRLAAEAKAAEEARILAEEQRREAEEVMKKAVEERRRTEEALREAQERMRTEEAETRRQVEEEMRRLADQARRQEEEARRREEEARRREGEAQRLAAESMRREEEAKRQAEEATERVEEAKRRAEEAVRQAQEAQRQAEERWMQGIPPEFRPTEELKQHFRQRYAIQDDKINIAIVGESGMGKSSLLNALRGLRPRDPGAARCGFNETTRTVRGYPDLRNPNFVWYDVPGANTPNVQGWQYFRDQGLFVFDVMVIVFADRFTQTAGTLIGNANRCYIPAFLVRTKADQLIRNLKNDDDGDEPLSDQEARQIVIDQTRLMVSDNLDTLKLPRQMVYIVSKPAMLAWVNDQNITKVIDESRFLDDILMMTNVEDAPLDSSTRALPHLQ
ncbi:interferon-inducible GTPase-domain-containing protein [Panaeolus papilionaceus]|nr:interferon-inducible GTPase-domain-containing protein [Panaeolus papilionaceus]